MAVVMSWSVEDYAAELTGWASGMNVAKEEKLIRTYPLLEWSSALSSALTDADETIS